jgi:hypothetical protein
MYLCVEKSAFHFVMFRCFDVLKTNIASVGLCNYVNLCIYVSKNQCSIL